MSTTKIAVTPMKVAQISSPEATSRSSNARSPSQVRKKFASKSRLVEFATVMCSQKTAYGLEFSIPAYPATRSPVSLMNSANALQSGK